MDIRYAKALPPPEESGGDRPPGLVELFSQLYMRSNGDLEQALEWLRRLAERYGLTGRGKTFEDLLDELEEKGVIERERGGFALTPLGDRAIRDSVFERVFRGLGKGLRGAHAVPRPGRGGERQPETRPYRFGDDASDLDVGATFKNALGRAVAATAGAAGAETAAAEAASSAAAGAPADWDGFPPGRITEEDMEVHESEQLAACSTVLMLDISHSMILYGEDRITPAKMVAMSLVEHVRRRYPRDTIDVITFGDEAEEIPADRIAHVSVGPFHTNTCDGLRLAQQLLRRRKNGNKQIFMVTDGKPSAVFDRGRLYRNSFGLDPLVLSRTFAEARNCRRAKIRVCTFMVASDPYLIEFVENFSKVCGGKAFYTGLDKLGEYVFVDYAAHRRGKIR